MSSKYTCQLPTEAREFAEEILNETDNSRKFGLAVISKWALENPQLHIRIEDKHLLQFLRRCKFNLEKTKTKIRNYYIMRRDRTEWFENRDPNLPEIQHLVKLGCFLALKQTYENHLVIIVRAGAHDPNVHSLENVFKAALMVLDVALKEEEIAQVYGVVAIIDLANISVGHAQQLSISCIKNMVHAWENYHCRPHQIYFVNAPTFVNVVLDVFKTFMSEKLKKRVKVKYGGNSAFCKIVDKKILPKDYGGDGETVEKLGNYWIEKLTSYADWFQNDEQYKAAADE